MMSLRDLFGYTERGDIIHNTDSKSIRHIKLDSCTAYEYGFPFKSRYARYQINLDLTALFEQEVTPARSLK